MHLDRHDIGHDREDGQAVVEFALVLPILTLIIFATIQFGLAFWNMQQVSAAASEGARRAAVSRTATDRDGRVVTAVRNASPNLTPTRLNVSTSSTWAPGSTVTVTVRYPQRIRVLGITFFNGDLTGRRTARVEP